MEYLDETVTRETKYLLKFEGFIDRKKKSNFN